MKQTYKSYFYILILVYISGSIGFVVNPSFLVLLHLIHYYLLVLVFLIHSPLTDKNSFAFFLLRFCFIIEVVGVKLD
jgi:putative membrane protein